MIEEVVLVVVFCLLMIACVLCVSGISYVFYQLFEGREIHIKMDAYTAESEVKPNETDN